MKDIAVVAYCRTGIAHHGRRARRPNRGRHEMPLPCRPLGGDDAALGSAIRILVSRAC